MVRVLTLPDLTGNGKESSTLSAIQSQWDARVQASPENIPLPLFISSNRLSGFMSLHSRISPPVPSFSCCPGFSNVAPGKLRENGRESVAQHLPPCTPFPAPAACLGRAA